MQWGDGPRPPWENPSNRSVFTFRKHTPHDPLCTAAWFVLRRKRANSGDWMKVSWLRRSGIALAGILCLALATAASAQVVVTVQGDTAYATISLTGSNGVTYDADVTIVFDTPQHLSPRALNLTAELINPDDIDPRLAVDQYGNSNCYSLLPPPLGTPICPTVDPAFPVMITVEPVVLPWLFSSGFDNGDVTGGGTFSFVNTYQFDVHTHDLVYADRSPYRLFKAQIGDNFHDVSTDVMPGSVRVRGRGGEFSQFVVASDPRSNSGLLAAESVSLEKILELDTRILASILSDGLRLDLLDLLAQVNALLLIDLTGALAALDNLIDLIHLNAGSDIANVWSADHSVVNDAGGMDELAQTLKFSMQLQQGAAPNR